jgi:hypothetical protein
VTGPTPVVLSLAEARAVASLRHLLSRAFGANPTPPLWLELLDRCDLVAAAKPAPKPASLVWTCEAHKSGEQVTATEAARRLGASSSATREALSKGRISGGRSPSGRWVVCAECLGLYAVDHRRRGPSARPSTARAS